MQEPNATPTPKVHPASREMLPDDPLQMHGVEAPGEAWLMLQMLVEEYARLGYGVESILELARDPNYQAFHGLWNCFGEKAFTDRVREILARRGVFAVQYVEAVSDDRELVQIELPE